MMEIKKYAYFPLWKFEKIEKLLEDMEKNGYRLKQVKYSYCFLFVKSIPKERTYFLSYKSFKGPSMGCCDYSFLSNHDANIIDSKMCYYATYRTKESKDKLSLMYEVRLDYLKRILLEKALTAMFFTIMFLIITCLAVSFNPIHQFIWVLYVFIGISLGITILYFYGFVKQNLKCKK